MTSNGLNDRLLEIYSHIEMMEKGCETFFGELMSVAGCEMLNFNRESFNKNRVTKQMLSGYVHKLNNISLTKSNLLGECCDFASKLVKENDQLRHESSQLKSATIKAHDNIISLQKELLICKDTQIKGVQTVLQNAVQKSVETEMKSYSEVVGLSAQKAPEMKCPQLFI